MYGLGRPRNDGSWQKSNEHLISCFPLYYLRSKGCDVFEDSTRSTGCYLPWFAAVDLVQVTRLSRSRDSEWIFKFGIALIKTCESCILAAITASSNKALLTYFTLGEVQP